MELGREVSDVWEPLGSLIAAGSLSSGIENISLDILSSLPVNSVYTGSLANALELVLRDVEVLDPLIESSLKHPTALSIGMRYRWPHDLKDEQDRLCNYFSQPNIEGALRMKLPKIFQKVRLSVSASHYVL